MSVLYNVGVLLYGTVLRIASLFLPKARLWVGGRKNWPSAVRKAIDLQRPRIWFHCASLGEFEQARNLIEEIREKYPHYQLILSFFSPSGYEVRKTYNKVDFVCYLPLDTPANAKKWVRLVQPELVFVVKYELWLNVFRVLKKQQIPLLLVAARIREQTGLLNIFRKRLYRKGFAFCTHIFAQDETSAKLIQQFSPESSVNVSFDTRYDRVLSSFHAHTDIPAIAAFKQERLCLVCGSTWPKDESHLFEMYEQVWEELNLCLIIAPHEINQRRIEQWCQTYPEESLRFSHVETLESKHRILWIDNIGMLSRLYAYADIAFIGGAWGKKVHNILEAVVFGTPVIFGPQHSNLPEVPELLAIGGAFSVKNPSELTTRIRSLAHSEGQIKQIQQINTAFVTERAGATSFILKWCKKGEYLTSAKPA